MYHGKATGTDRKVSGSMMFDLILFSAVLLMFIGFFLSSIFPVVVAISLLIYLIYHRIRFLLILRDGEMFIQRDVPVGAVIFKDRELAVHTRLVHTYPNGKLEVREQLPPGTAFVGGELEARQRLDGPGFIDLGYRIRSLKRGTIRIGDTRVKLTDPRGLYSANIRITDPLPLRSHASLEEIRKAKIAARQHSLELTHRAPRTPQRISRSDFDGIRDYAPSDRLRDIEWKASSRLLKMMTKVFEDETMAPVYLLLDCSTSMKKGTRGHTKLDHSVALSLQLLKILDLRGYPVGLAAYNERRVLEFIEPSGRKQQFDMLFNRLYHIPDPIVMEHEDARTRAAPGVQAELLEGNDVENDPGGSISHFLVKIAPFTGGASSGMVGEKLHMTRGVYQAVQRMAPRTMDGEIYIFITDLETDTRTLVRSIKLVHSRKARSVVVAPFSGFYNHSKKDMDPQLLEELYRRYTERAVLTRHLKVLGTLVIDTDEKTEGSTIMIGLKELER